MTVDKKLNQFTLVDVIERKIHFTNINTIFDKTDYKDNDEGELLAYNEMLAGEIDKLSGYNNAIVSILV